MNQQQVLQDQLPAAYAAHNRLLRISVVESMTGISRRMIYQHIRNGKFPRQYKPGGWSSRWSEREVLGWIANQRHDQPLR